MPVILTSRDCRRFGLVDGVISEPAEGAHKDHVSAAQHVRLAVIRSFAELAALGPRRLRDERLRKYRQLGMASPVGSEAIRIEIAQLQELQQSFGRSIDDLRVRLEHHQLTLPTLPHLPQRPALPNVPLPVRLDIPSIRRPSVNRAEIADLATRLATSGREFAGRVNEARHSLSTDEPDRRGPDDPGEPRT
jgi:hypothetical protein